MDSEHKLPRKRQHKIVDNKASYGPPDKSEHFAVMTAHFAVMTAKCSLLSGGP